LKPHYEPVLRQHIEQTFMEGFRDGLAQKAGVPPNNRQIPTPRGSVESWLPLHHLATIYQAGSEFAIGNPEEHLRLQQNLDQVTAMLYARTNFELKDPYSETLLKLPIKEGLIPDPELVSQTVPEMLSLEGEKELSSEPLGENPNSEQSAKLQELSNSLSNFDALGEGEQVATAAHQPTPDESSVTTPQAAPLPPVEAQAVLEPGNLAVKEAQTV
jgi:hypothetical protein